MRSIAFVSSSPEKYEETSRILGRRHIEVEFVRLATREIQHQALARVVRQKALDAFGRIYRRLIVDHTALFVRDLCGLPAGLTGTFFEFLEPRDVCRLFGAGLPDSVRATTAVAYCDGRTVEVFRGDCMGRFAPTPSGSGRGFGWDRIFIPNGSDRTFAELGADEKDKVSMRRRALERFGRYFLEHDT